MSEKDFTGKLLCLSGRGVTRVFGLGDKKTVAVDHVDFDFHEGEFVSIVGESGSGKTTLSKMLLGLLNVSEGEILFQGKPRDISTHAKKKEYWKGIQAIFQDPFSSLDPRLMAGESLLEGLDAQRIGTPAERRAAVEALLGDVGLPPRRPGAIPISSAAASGSVLVSPAPWPSRPTSSSATSAPAPSTCPSRRRCSTCCAGSSAAWASRISSSPTTSAWSATSPTASPSSRMSTSASRARTQS